MENEETIQEISEEQKRVCVLVANNYNLHKSEKNKTLYAKDVVVTCTTKKEDCASYTLITNRNDGLLYEVTIDFENKIVLYLYNRIARKIVTTEEFLQEEPNA